MKTLMIAAALGASLLTATATQAQQPQEPAHKTQAQAPKKAAPEHHAMKAHAKAESQATKEQHTNKAEMKAAPEKAKATKPEAPKNENKKPATK